MHVAALLYPGLLACCSAIHLRERVFTKVLGSGCFMFPFPFCLAQTTIFFSNFSFWWTHHYINKFELDRVRACNELSGHAFGEALDSEATSLKHVAQLSYPELIDRCLSPRPREITSSQVTFLLLILSSFLSNLSFSTHRLIHQSTLQKLNRK